MTVLFLALAAASPAVSISINPPKVCVDGRANRNPNFDFDIRNTSTKPITLTELKASSRAANGDLIEQRILWQDALASMGPQRTIPANGEALLFNPFTFDHPQRTSTIDYAFSFDDGSSQTVSIKPADCTTKANLRVPLSGRILVYDGYDVLAHHRRERFHIQPDFRAFGLVDNPYRYALDFIPIDSKGNLAGGGGGSIGDFYGWDKPVFAPGDGVVTAVRGDMPDNALGSEDYPRQKPSEDEMNSDGNYVLIDHGTGEISAMSHLKAGSIAVKAGDRVRQGQIIARVGNSGATPIPHLHYELRTGGVGAPGFGMRAIRAVPPYFRGMKLFGTPTPPGKVALGTGDVVIVP